MENLSLESLDNLLVDITNRCRAIRDRSVLLLNSEFASENPEKLAKLIGDICIHLKNHVTQLRDKYNSDPANVINDVRIIDDFVRDLGAHLRYVDGAIATKLPWSLPQPLERLAQKVIPGTNLMLRPQWKYNYAILPYDIGQLYRSELDKVLSPDIVNNIFQGFPDRFHIISFPAVERHTALLHCDLGHEIGHLVAKRFLELEDQTSSYLVDLRASIAAKVKQEEPNEKPLIIQELIQEKLELAAAVRWFGLAEIISDMFAVRLLGPAALFALFQMAIGDSMDLHPSEETSFYPPWRTRLRYALSTLEKTNLIPISRGEDNSPASETICQSVQKRIDEIGSLTSQDSDTKAIESDWVIHLAYQSIEATVDEVDNYLHSELGHCFLSRDVLYKDIYHLVNRLAQKIPPNAIERTSFETRPADLEIILNAAWFFRITYLVEPFGSGGQAENFEREYRILNRLTLKAVEYSNLQSLYQDWASKQEKK